MTDPRKTQDQIHFLEEPEPSLSKSYIYQQINNLKKCIVSIAEYCCQKMLAYPEPPSLTECPS